MFGSPNRYFKENSRWVPLKRGAPLSSLAMTEFQYATRGIFLYITGFNDILAYHFLIVLLN